MQRMHAIIYIILGILKFAESPLSRNVTFSSAKNVWEKASALWGDREQSWGRTMFPLSKFKKCFVTKFLSHGKSASQPCQRTVKRSLPCLVTLNLLEGPWEWYGHALDRIFVSNMYLNGIEALCHHVQGLLLCPMLKINHCALLIACRTLLP